MGKKLIAGLASLFLFTGFTAAQGQITVHPGVLIPGSKVEVGFSDPKRSGEEVVVTIDDGRWPVPATVEIVIQLDRDGNGTGLWEVPYWEMARLNAKGASQLMLIIEE